MSTNPVTQFLQLLAAKQQTEIRNNVYDPVELLVFRLQLPRFSDHNLQALFLEDKSKTMFWDHTHTVEHKFRDLIVASGLPPLKHSHSYDWTTSILFALGVHSTDEITILHELEKEISDHTNTSSLPFVLILSITSITGIAVLILDDETCSFYSATPNGPFRTVYLLRSKVIKSNVESSYVRIYKRELGSELAVSKLLSAISVPETRLLNLNDMFLAKPSPVCLTQIFSNGNGFTRVPVIPDGAERTVSGLNLLLYQRFHSSSDKLLQAIDPSTLPTPISHTLEYRAARNLDPLVSKTNVEFSNMDIYSVRARAQTIVPGVVKKKVGAFKGFKFSKGHSVLNFDRQQAKERGLVNHAFIPILLITPVQTGCLYLANLTIFSNDVTCAKYVVIDESDVISHLIIVIVENCSAQSICRPTAIYNCKEEKWQAEKRSCEYFLNLLARADDDRRDDVEKMMTDHVLLEPEMIDTLTLNFMLAYDSVTQPDEVEYDVETMNYPAHTRIYHDLSTWYNVWPSMTSEAYHRGRIDSDKDLANSFSCDCHAQDVPEFTETKAGGIVMPCGREVLGGSHAAMLHRCSFELLGYMPNEEDRALLRDFRNRQRKHPPHYAVMSPCYRCSRAYPNIILADLCHRYGCPGGKFPTSTRYFDLEYNIIGTPEVITEFEPLSSSAAITPPEDVSPPDWNDMISLEL